MNPITLDQNNTLIAGLHRLEATKLLGWAEIECNIIGMSSQQASSDRQQHDPGCQADCPCQRFDPGHRTENFPFPSRPAGRSGSVAGGWDGAISGAVPAGTARKILAARPPLLDMPPEDTRTKAEKNREKVESLNGLVREFAQFIGQFLDRMKMYQGFADAFAEMSPTQISQVWDSAAAVDMAIIDFSKEVKAIQAEIENGGNEHEN